VEGFPYIESNPLRKEEKIMCRPILSRRLKTLLVSLLFSSGVSFVATGTFQNAFGAEEFPTREIRLILPLNPGGSIDIGSRLFAGKVEKILGVPVVVVNNTAGAGAAAILSVKEAKPDGYMLLGVPTTSFFILKPMMIPEVTYRYTDFTPICRIFGTPAALLSRADAPWKNMKELIEYIKAHPGTVRATGGPAGGFLNTLLHQFKVEAGVDIAIVPTGGGAAQSTALMGGHVELCMDPLTATIGFLRAGRVKILASEIKIKEFPAVRTFAEEGLPGVGLKELQGIYGPKGLPMAIVTKLAKAFEEASNDASLRKQMEESIIPPEYESSDEMTKATENQLVNVRNSLKKAGLLK
jgi:tripartite-type tricarboxylate transporter receptor subunit TctC